MSTKRRVKLVAEVRIQGTTENNLIASKTVYTHNELFDFLMSHGLIVDFEEIEDAFKYNQIAFFVPQRVSGEDAIEN